MYNVSMKEYMVMNKELSSIDLANAILMSGGNVSADSAQVENIFDL
ncbi:Protein of unknown function [Gryllus bimaculatus]|nr:Protein of unknown function [Gryllus bimaculatus]